MPAAGMPQSLAGHQYGGHAAGTGMSFTQASLGTEFGTDPWTAPSSYTAPAAFRPLSRQVLREAGALPSPLQRGLGRAPVLLPCPAAPTVCRT